MKVSVSLCSNPIVPSTDFFRSLSGHYGALIEFTGVVRDTEEEKPIVALIYQAYAGMAEKQMMEIIDELGNQYPCQGVQVIHRTGRIPVGEAAIYVGVAGRHRKEAFTLCAEFMNALKRDVPIWKVGTEPEGERQENGHDTT